MRASYGHKILIDEITRVKDLVSHSAFLADTLCMSGRKVVISGTDSLVLAKMEYAGLYHRVNAINVTHISYAEARRTAEQSLKEYIDMGGLYRAQAITDIEGLRQYIDTAVDDIYALPEGQRAELFDGKIYYMDPPGRTHHKISWKLHQAIANYIDSKG